MKNDRMMDFGSSFKIRSAAAAEKFDLSLDAKKSSN